MSNNLLKNNLRVVQGLNDPLIKNSFYMIFSSISNSGLGFLFWMLAAKLYSPEDVGIATALISFVGLLMLLSRFGLDFSLIRFFPTNNKSKIFSTYLNVTTLFVIIFSIIFIRGIEVFSPELKLLNSPLNALIFLVISIVNSMLMMTGMSFVATRRSDYYFFQNVLLASRILFLIPLMRYRAIGIFASVGLSFIIAFLFAWNLLKYCGICFTATIDRDILYKTLSFSTGNYLAGLFISGPSMILPIMVLNIVGEEQAAYYYIAYSIAGILFTIPNSISTSLFVEGSHGEALKKSVIRSLTSIFSIMVPFIVIIYISGELILKIFGTDYAAEGLNVLRIMVIASSFVGINYVFFAIKRIQKETKGLIIHTGFNFVLLIGFSYFYLLKYGLAGVGYAWLESSFIGSIFLAADIILREKWFQIKRNV